MDRAKDKEYVHKKGRYDLCTGDGAGNRSDFSDQSQRT